MISGEIADRLWEGASEILFISKDEFLRSLEGWQSEPVYCDGELAFVFFIKGPEFHFQSLSKRHLVLLMKMSRERLQKLIDIHGYALTRTPKMDTRQHSFNRAFGFSPVGEDEFDVCYRIETLRGRSH